MISVVSRIWVRPPIISFRLCTNALIRHEQTTVTYPKLDKMNRNAFDNQGETSDCATQASSAILQKYVDTVVSTKPSKLGENDLKDEEELNALDTWHDNIPKLVPFKKPPCTFAYIANESKTIQELINLGVPLYKLESDHITFGQICNLDYQAHVQPIIETLRKHNLPWQHIFQKMPKVLLSTPESLENLLRYLNVKGFSSAQLLELFTKSPKSILLKPSQIEPGLKYIKKKIELSHDELNEIVVRCPRLLHFPEHRLEECMLLLNNTLEFNMYQIKQMVNNTPELWTKNVSLIEKNFYYALEKMGLTRSDIVNHCKVLIAKPLKLKLQHEFLVCLNKAQYNKTKPGYISPTVMVKTGMEYFALEIAKVDLELFRNFIKMY